MSSMDSEEMSSAIRSAGVAGAGGAGFPTYQKWARLGEVDNLLVNLQESEPNCYTDKWLSREYAEELAEFLIRMNERYFDTVVIGTKLSYREEWIAALEEHCCGTPVQPADLPIDTSAVSDIVFAYTPDVYTYGEEQVLLMVTTGTQIESGLPTDQGWIVNNIETVDNIRRAIDNGTPVTHKYVHVGGDVPEHGCFEVPIGTPSLTLLREVGLEGDTLPEGSVLVDGGPGWCTQVTEPPERYGVRKRTNAVQVVDRDTVVEHTDDEGRTNLLEAADWGEGPHNKEPTPVTPERVRLPLISNPAFEGLVARSKPVVEIGDSIARGDTVAEPSPDGISNPTVSSISGVVTDITDSTIVVSHE